MNGNATCSTLELNKLDAAAAGAGAAGIWTREEVDWVAIDLRGFDALFAVFELALEEESDTRTDEELQVCGCAEIEPAVTSQLSHARFRAAALIVGMLTNTGGEATTSIGELVEGLASVEETSSTAVD